MPITEAQLDTWSKQGSVVQSRDTYASIRNILQDVTAQYASRTCEIFLQGSYGNDTNIYADSDVDIVIVAHSIYYSDTSGLKPDEVAAFYAALTDGGYSHDDFRGSARQ